MLLGARFGLMVAPALATLTSVVMHSAWFSAPFVAIFGLDLAICRSRVELDGNLIRVVNPGSETVLSAVGAVLRDGRFLGLHPGALCITDPDGNFTYCWGLGRRLFPFGRNDLPQFKDAVVALGGRVDPDVVRFGERPSAWRKGLS